MDFTAHAALYFNEGADSPGPFFADACEDMFTEYLNFDSADGESSLAGGLVMMPHLGKPHSMDRAAGTSALDVADVALHDFQDQCLDSWDFAQKPAPPAIPLAESNLYLHHPSGATYSDSELSLGGISLHSPQDTPLSPSLPSSPKSPTLEASVRTKHRFLDTLSKSLSIPKLRRAAPNTESQQRSPIRKVTTGSPTRKVTLGTSPQKSHAGTELHRLSPQRKVQASPTRKFTSPSKMMAAARYNQHNPHNQLNQQSMEDWSARLQTEAAKFRFGFNDNTAPLSPPPSARVSDASDKCATMMTHQPSVEDAFQWDQPVPQYTGRTLGSTTPLATPNRDIHAFAPDSNAQVDPTMLFPTTPHQHSATGQSIGNGDLWQQSQGDADYNQYIAQPDFMAEADQAPMWWGNASSTPMAQPSPALYHRTPVADTKSVAMQLQSELAYNANELALSPSNLPQGLMIRLPHSPVHQSYVVGSSQMPQALSSSYYSTVPPHLQPHAQAQLQTPRHRCSPSHTIPVASPRAFQTPQVAKPRGRSELSQPPSPTSMMGQRSSSFHVQKRRQGSTHSIGRSRKPSEYQRSASCTNSPKKNQKGSGASGFGDFVNFTPSDSSKILTGVAPSGSSKTKARREKEAMEKRRRLSQAAIRAVQAAGGDIASLADDGLFV